MNIIELPPTNAEIKWVDSIQVATRNEPALVYINFQAIVPLGENGYKGEVAKVMMPIETAQKLIDMLQGILEDN